MEQRQKILDHLFSLHRRGRIKYDLERVREAAARIGNPQTAYRVVHVAGTNGKGTVCSMVAAVMRAAGYRTGLFIKPHLVAFEERFLIDGRPVSTELWLDVYVSIEKHIKELSLTFFEISTLVAFEVFRRAGVAWAVIETGMGGRLDATNIVTPSVSVLTAIGRDHTDWLGDTLTAIAKEKLGIVKRGVPVVMIEPKEPDVRAVAAQVCAQQEAPLVFVNENMATDVREVRDGVRFFAGKQRYHIPLQGRHQVLNALCAAQVAKQAEIGDPQEIAAGIESVWVPGRFQVERRGEKALVFDIAHNPAAAESLARTLAVRFNRRSLCCVVGVMRDKEVEPILSALAGVATRMVVTQPAIARACPAEQLAVLSRRMDCRVEVVARVAEAIAVAVEGAEPVVCITGSCYTVGEAMQALDIEPYTQ